jgi:ArsR family metal-binding transcriptional regulator
MAPPMSDRSKPADLLIHGYRLDLSEILCHPGAAAWNAKALVEDCIGAVLPYLNAELKGADYHHDLETLIWRTGRQKYALRPHEITVAPVKDREEAGQLMDDMVGVVNTIWKRRADIKPSFSCRRLPGLLDIYKLLPATNCRQCGYSSCLAYAAQLREGKAELSQCPSLSGDSCGTILDQFAHGLEDSRGSRNE